MSVEFRVTSEKETADLARRLAEQMRPGDVVLLTGELGTGKTTFVRALARGRGVQDDVASPSYTVVTEYAGPPGSPLQKLVHLDLYRLTPDEAAFEGAVQEALAETAEPGRVTVIEWADRLGPRELLPAWRLVFGHGETESERIITVEAWPDGRRWQLK